MAGIDKLQTQIAGRPLLAWTLAALAASSQVDRIVLVVAAGTVERLRAESWLPAKVVRVVEGGSRRQDSVAAGMAALETLGAPPVAADGGDVPVGHQDDRIVLVHDGARPLLTTALIGAVIAAATQHGAAIPVTPMVDTVKRVVDGLVMGTVDRAQMASAQTPQGMRRSLLRAALAQAHAEVQADAPAQAQAHAEAPVGGGWIWTDEASLLEACRIPVHAIPGDPMNIKVTTPDDLNQVSRALFGRASLRVGLGDDGHPFGPGAPLALGGVTIAGAPRLSGHSDGDAALHAVADALLGAAGLGDLGRLFPAGPATPVGIASAELVRDVVRRLADVGLRPASVDLTIIAARPRLVDWLDPMRSAIAGLLGLPTELVNVKASSGNLAGFEGAGRGIAARAVAVVEPTT